MSLLDKLGLKYNCDKSSRFHNYLDFYQDHFPDRDFSGRLLEIGVMDGVSLKMWQEYFPHAGIVGIDIYDKQHLYNKDWGMPRSVSLFKVDGTDPEQLGVLGMFDIIIDDGSHFTADQQASFTQLYYHQLNPGGIYIVEDIWTSYMDQYQNSELNTIDWLNDKGLSIFWFKYEHGLMGKVFPQWPQYADLASQTVIIMAGK
jgi:hypothetical protein